MCELDDWNGTVLNVAHGMIPVCLEFMQILLQLSVRKNVLCKVQERLFVKVSPGRYHIVHINFFSTNPVGIHPCAASPSQSTSLATKSITEKTTRAILSWPNAL
jgi:hypothetical protein